MKTSRIAGAALWLLATTAGAAAAQAPISGNLSPLDDAEIDARIAFIEERLDEGEQHAKWWQRGFTGLYSAGIVIGTVNAVTESGDDRTIGIVGAVKAVFGTTRMLLSPHPGRVGGNPVRAVQGDSREAREERLEVAETQLDLVADRARSRLSWKPHAANLGVNLVAGLVIGFVANTEDAVIDSTVGFVVGEIMAFSMPWRGTRDVQDYKERFDMASQPTLSWHVEPITRLGIHGAAVRVRF